jgi:hypothetical protein
MGVQEIGCTDVDRIVLSRGIVIYVANAVMDFFFGWGGYKAFGLYTVWGISSLYERFLSSEGFW